MAIDPLHWSLNADLDAALDQGGSLWGEFRNARIFMSGGTGFIGTWLLELLKAADLKFELELRVTIMSRNPSSISVKAPHLADYESFQFETGDVLCSKIARGCYTHFIHGATEASAALNERDPLKMFDTILQGTRWGLEFARQNSVTRSLMMSSGAIYGTQPLTVSNVSEEWIGAPSCTDPRAAYAEGKRAAEMLTAIYTKQFGIVTTTARIFSVLGPYLFLDMHFAAGNFIREAIQRRDILVNGSGRASRSYLYASDLALWLLFILQRGIPSKSYNVGSENAISIAELASLTSRLLGGGQVKILGKTDTGWNSGRYVPDTRIVRSELGVMQTVSLEQAICRTASWNGWRPV